MPITDEEKLDQVMADLAKSAGVSEEVFVTELYNSVLDSETDHEKLRYWAKLSGKLARSRASEINSLKVQRDELLEALEGLVRYVEAVRYQVGMGKSQQERYEKARALIAKARGEA